MVTHLGAIILRESSPSRILKKNETSKLLFQRIVREIAASIIYHLRVELSAIDALCDSAEDYVLRGDRQGSQTTGAAALVSIFRAEIFSMLATVNDPQAGGEADPSTAVFGAATSISVASGPSSLEKNQQRPRWVERRR